PPRPRADPDAADALAAQPRRRRPPAHRARPAGRRGMSRALAFGALVVAAALLAALVLRGTTHYTVHAEFQDAGQLVKGDRVSVGGITIGSVKSIGLGDRSQAVVTLDITDKSFSPLHTGTTATIRSPSLSTQASRYISIAPGPN